MAFYHPTGNLKYQFNYTENHNLLGVWTIIVKATLQNFQEFNYFMQIERTFTVTVTSACETTTFTHPPLQRLYNYTLDVNDRQILAIDVLRDDISKLAVTLGRSKTKIPFCDAFPHTFELMSFTQ